MIHIGSGFKRGLLQAGADRRGNMRGCCAVFQHCFKRVFNNAAERTAPAGMGGTDDAVFCIQKQYRRAVGGADADYTLRMQAVMTR